MRKSFILLLTFLLLLPILVSADGIIEVDRQTDIPSFLGYVQDRIIVVMKPETGKLQTEMSTSATIHIGDAAFDAISDKYAVSIIEKQFQSSKTGPFSNTAELAKYHKITFNDGTLDEVVAAYENNPLVESVERIGIHAMYATPNDQYYDPYQWYHNQANDDDIDSPEAWNVQTGNSSIVLAILDSGTRYYHPDLGGANATVGNPGASRGNMWTNTAELNGSAGVDDDGNGFVDDWIGYDFIQSTSGCWSGEDCGTQDNDPRDFNGHGTHTAGIVGMLTNDGYGMAGVAGGWGNGSQAVTGNGVKVMALRMGFSYNYLGQEYGVVYMDAAAEAFYYASDNGASIASCSWGSSNSGGISAAASYFTNNGGLIFVAAGNDGTQNAPYLNTRSDVISVAATDQNDGAASFTTYGTWVDISAPGVGIYSTYHDHTDPNTNYWSSMDGTSMACPLAAGVGAMIWSQNPSWTAAQVEAQLYSSADDIDAELSSGYIGKMGAGRVNLYNAVNTGPPPAPVANFTGSPTSGTEPLNVNFTDQSTGSITNWFWNFGDGNTSTAQSPSHTYTSAGTYTVALEVNGPGGNDTNTKTNFITVNACVNPTAGFVGSPTSGDYPLNVSFTDQSSNASSYAWTFGDGGTSTSASPSHTYTSAGTYSVTQTVTNACGSDPMTRTNYITVTTPPCNSPVAAFSGTPTSGTAPLAVSFSDASTNNPTSWSWTFGDGGTSTSQNPNYSYTAAGTYSVSLTATNSCGSDPVTMTNYITVTAGGGWTTITYDDFESGWGNFSDGGSDCARYTRGTYSPQGNASIRIRDNSGVSSSTFHSSGQDVSGYQQLEIQFDFFPRSMENGEDFWIQYYDGSSWITLVSYARGVDFNNNTFYTSTISFNSSQVNFPSNAKLRFMCDASGNSDYIFLDVIEFRGTTTPAAAADADGPILFSNTSHGEMLTDDLLPDDYEVLQNYPNPFNPTTTISFTLGNASVISLEVFNIQGQKVATLATGSYSAGTHAVEFDASDLSSGVYLYRLTTDENVETKKMLLLK